MLAMLARQSTGAKIDEISVLGEDAWQLGRFDLVIDIFLSATFTLQGEFETAVNCRPFLITPQHHRPIIT